MGEARRRKLAGYIAPEQKQETVSPIRKVGSVGGGRSSSAMMLMALMAGMMHEPSLPREILREMRR